MQTPWVPAVGPKDEELAAFEEPLLMPLHVLPPGILSIEVFQGH